MSRLSRRSLLRAATGSPLGGEPTPAEARSSAGSLAGSLADAQDVDDEGEGGVLGDAALRAARRTVGVRRRGDDQHATALLHPDESLVPGLDEAAGAEREGGRGLGVGLVEGLL